ncbi:MAG TPA: thiol peroxidase [Haploplasma sp.]|nr:thiol peroxidase [Haploplasma sp.]
MKTMHNDEIMILGKELKIGDKAPNFKLITNELGYKSLEDFKKDYLLISVVPSLDTGVCDFQTRNINEKLTSFHNVDFITVSNDLPFAQKRWCGMAGLEITTLSDYQTNQFGLDYGLLIDGLKLLARAVIVLDKNHQVVYKEYLNEMTNHPNYDALIDFLNTL